MLANMFFEMGREREREREWMCVFLLIKEEKECSSSKPCPIGNSSR